MCNEGWSDSCVKVSRVGGFIDRRTVTRVLSKKRENRLSADERALWIFDLRLLNILVATTPNNDDKTELNISDPTAFIFISRRAFPKAPSMLFVRRLKKTPFIISRPRI